MVLDNAASLEVLPDPNHAAYRLGRMRLKKTILRDLPPSPPVPPAPAAAPPAPGWRRVADTPGVPPDWLDNSLSSSPPARHGSVPPVIRPAPAVAPPGVARWRALLPTGWKMVLLVLRKLFWAGLVVTLLLLTGLLVILAVLFLTRMQLPALLLTLVAIRAISHASSVRWPALLPAGRRMVGRILVGLVRAGLFLLKLSLILTAIVLAGLFLAGMA